MYLREIVRKITRLGAWVPAFRPAILAYYERKLPGWNRQHPYDRANGVRTSGMLPGSILGLGSTNSGASQPSIIRSALGAIPDPRRCHFLDLGCGKGRPLLVATEFGFSAITGVEFSPALAEIARRNAAVFARGHPERTRVDIVIGDALALELPEENLVVFLYNPFDRPLITRLLHNIESSLRASPREFYIVYYNPTWADVFDASSAVERRYAAQLPYDAGEIGYGPDESDAVVIWQNRGNRRPRPPGDPGVPVSIVSPGVRAEISAQARSPGAGSTPRPSCDAAGRRQPAAAAPAPRRESASPAGGC
jgi:SAM-dependent methyltransferase